MQRRRRRNRSLLAFTLVELLVVIGIIALLISILLPALNRVRVAGQVVSCLSNVRQLAMAVQGYVNNNRGVLPAATYNNKGSISPKGTGQDPWRAFASPTLGPTVTLPCIGESLMPYLGKSDKVWQCPTGGAEYSGVDPYASGGANPITGHATDDVWLPNYFYMCPSLYYSPAGSNPSVSATRVKPGFNNADWVVRNVSNLRAGTVRSVSGQTSSDVVVFLEYKSFFHTQNALRSDIYSLADGQTGKYQGNFGFLDGHAETRRYKDRDGYLAQLHDPIVQKQFGVDYAQRFPEQFQAANFYREGKP